MKIQNQKVINKRLYQLNEIEKRWEPIPRSVDEGLDWKINQDHKPPVYEDTEINNMDFYHDYDQELFS